MGERRNDDSWNRLRTKHAGEGPVDVYFRVDDPYLWTFIMWAASASDESESGATEGKLFFKDPVTGDLDFDAIEMQVLRRFPKLETWVRSADNSSVDYYRNRYRNWFEPNHNR